MKLNISRFISRFQVVDLLALVAGLIIVVSFVLFFFRNNTFITVLIRVTDDGIYGTWTHPESHFAYLFQKGMKQKDSLGRVTAEIHDVKLYDIGPYNKAAFLEVQLKAVENKNTGGYEYNGKPLLIASNIKIEFPNLLVQGLILDVNNQNETKEKKELLLEAKLQSFDPTFPETRGVEPYMEKSVTIGQKVMGVEGETLAEIIDKKSYPAEKITTNDRGEVRVQYDPIKKDVFLKLKVKVSEINGEYWFMDSIRLLVGESIPLDFGTIQVWPTIISINQNAVIDNNN